MIILLSLRSLLGLCDDCKQVIDNGTILGSLPLLCQVLKDPGILSSLSMEVTILLWVCV